MRSASLARVAAASLLSLLVARTADATIVVEGREVAAWPAEALRSPGPTVAYAVDAKAFYPRPQGEVFGLTLLVDFSDTPPAFSKADIDAWLNQRGYVAGGLNGSVRDYFYDQSNGKVDFRNELFGFYRAKHPKSHYEATSGYQGSDELFTELMDYFDAQVDFSKYDNDGDGRSDAVSIVYAGEAETWGKGLWPHASFSNQKRDGVTIARYMMTSLGTRFELYTFCHEVGHMLFGWPDLYGFGNYCIMGNASTPRNPVGINDFYRADQGWIETVDVEAMTNAQFTATVNGAGYRYVNPERPDECFFWSNVQSSGRFSSIEGDGLLLLHFDDAIGSNDPPETLSLAVVQADGKKELDATMWPEPGSDADDFFRSPAVSEFSAAKFATSKWNDGSASGIRIYDISASGPEMTFKVGTGPIVDPVGGAGGAGGGSVAGGAAGSAGTPPGGAAQGGASGGMAGTGGGGSPASGGASLTSGANAGGQAPGGAPPAPSGGTGSAPPPASDDGGCGCRMSPARYSPHLAWGLLLGLAWRRRRAQRGAPVIRP